MTKYQKVSLIDRKATGENLQNLIETSGFTKEDILRALRLNQAQTIYKWYRGRNLPSVQNLVSLSAMLQINISDILISKKPAGFREDR